MDHNFPFIFELIGPAGAGKTTIAQAILEMDAGISLKVPPYAGNVKNMPFYIQNALKLKPEIFIQIRKNQYRRVKKTILILSLLEGWADRLINSTDNHSKITLLDQGPVYLLSSLKTFVLPSIFSDEFQDWRDKIYKRWAPALNLVVWLDASDRTLIERVRNRTKNHGNEKRSDREIIEINNRYRNVFHEVTSNLKKHYPPLEVVQIDTGNSSVSTICEQILSLVN